MAKCPPPKRHHISAIGASFLQRVTKIVPQRVLFYGLSNGALRALFRYHVFFLSVYPVKGSGSNEFFLGKYVFPFLLCIWELLFLPVGGLSTCGGPKFLGRSEGAQIFFRIGRQGGGNFLPCAKGRGGEKIDDPQSQTEGPPPDEK